jgi:hypothetical protein
MLKKSGELAFDPEEEIMSAALIAHSGRVSHLGIAEQLGLLCVVPAKGREAA